MLCQLEIPDAAVVSSVGANDRALLPERRPRAADRRRRRPGRSSTATSSRWLKRRDGLVAVTLGAEGALLLEDGEEIARAEPPQVDAIDGTAAGDAFTACLLVSLLEGRDQR